MDLTRFYCPPWRAITTDTQRHWHCLISSSLYQPSFTQIIKLIFYFIQPLFSLYYLPMRHFEASPGNDAHTIKPVQILQTTRYYYHQYQGPALWQDSGSSVGWKSLTLRLIKAIMKHVSHPFPAWRMSIKVKLANIQICHNYLGAIAACLVCEADHCDS